MRRDDKVRGCKNVERYLPFDVLHRDTAGRVILDYDEYIAITRIKNNSLVINIYSTKQIF